MEWGPITVWGSWMSGELGATLLYIQSDLKARIESRSAFSSIKRVKPEASLFEIPPSYKVNLTQATRDIRGKVKIFLIPD
jgi:hypothetical protein